MCLGDFQDVFCITRHLFNVRFKGNTLSNADSVHKDMLCLITQCFIDLFYTITGYVRDVIYITVQSYVLLQITCNITIESTATKMTIINVYIPLYKILIYNHQITY